jgi:hypothetical protein
MNIPEKGLGVVDSPEEGLCVVNIPEEGLGVVNIPTESATDIYFCNGNLIRHT